MRGFGHLLILVLAAIILVPSSGAAQTAQRGKLTITVADPSGAVIPHAAVTLVQLEPPAKAGFSGVMTSPFFMTATGVQNPRKVDMGINLAF